MREQAANIQKLSCDNGVANMPHYLNTDKNKNMMLLPCYHDLKHALWLLNITNNYIEYENL